MLVRIWVRASDMVQAAFLSLEVAGVALGGAPCPAAPPKADGTSCPRAPACRASPSSPPPAAASGTGPCAAPAPPGTPMAIFEPSRYRSGRLANHAQMPRPLRKACGDIFVSNSRSRQCRISLGSGIRTGQTLSQLPQKVEALGRWPASSHADQAAASAPRPSGRDRPSHRHGRRRRHRPGSGSCRRRSGCSAACPGTRCRAWRCGRCRAARHGTAPARPGRPAAAGRSRTSCRTRIPGPWPSAPARAAWSTRPPASGRPSRCWPARCGSCGSVCVRSPLPSLVTITVEPVSAIRKLAPVMPTSAARNFWRSIVARLVDQVVAARRATGAGRAWCGPCRKLSATSSLLRWTAGAMMWLGGSWRSWMMYSPRSVSTGVDAVRFQMIVERDLLGDHRLALGDDLAHRPSGRSPAMASRASLGVRHQCTLPPVGGHVALELLQIEVEMWPARGS